MELLRCLVLLSTALLPFVKSQNLSNSSSTSTSPADDHHIPVDGGQEQHVTLTIIPSGAEELQLATGDTAILECVLTIQSSSSYRFKSLSWTNMLTHKTFSTYNITENGDDKTGVSLAMSSKSSNDNSTTTTSFVMTISNLTVSVSTPFRCEAEIEGEKAEKSISVTVIDADSFCTFEGNDYCEWQTGQQWKRQQSSTSGGQESCKGSLSDHTYGTSNTAGHFLVAEFDNDGKSPSGDFYLNRTVPGHEVPKCFRFFYRLCQTTTVTDAVSVTIVSTDETKLFSVPKNRPGEIWSEFNLRLQSSENNYQITVTGKETNGMFFAIDDIKLDSSGKCQTAQSATDVSSKQLDVGSMVDDPKPSLLSAPSSLSSSYAVSSSSLSSSSSSSPPPSSSAAASSSSSISASSSKSPSSAGSSTIISTIAIAIPSHPVTDEAPAASSTSSTSSTASTTVAPAVEPVTSMQTPTSKSLAPATVVSIRTTPTTADTTLSTALSSSLSSVLATSVSSFVSSGGAFPPRGTLVVITTSTRTDEVDASFRSTSQSNGSDDDDDDDGDDSDGGGGGAATGEATTTDNSTGLAIGIILAIMVAGACTAAILYRRRKNGKKSTYITFGNPSYSREHLPVNDFGLDSPLTLSSNGYTVLA